MQLPLILCLLATSVALGVSLSCEHCHGFGNTCNGTWQNCPSEQHSCGIVQAAGTGVLQMKGVFKTCVQSRNCDQPLNSFNLGKIGQILTRTTCCEGLGCQKTPPALPPINNTPNGKKCPSCYVFHSLKCEEEMADCTGDQIHCIEVAGTANMGGTSAEVLMKGCTNVLCNSTQDGMSFGGISVITTAICTPANGAASSIPGSFELVLQAFVGLLLLKVLG
ncbi:phospholipase A2 inhibitor and Ly6/PLAUR domain-containing protein-like [Eublepharis macularius]|uniref:Phospholipase A2 inhibitor and Ly6/PLAUR domain-containing protein-like n=1 Tax=Eublepharis macularius TaxID=481883 RepID=A0AA97KID8_EUBMA|nr:phospholipase A2 inhibitor and Ly6/PLAUR domain-containing protein-like [Eublepharis macularius]